MGPRIADALLVARAPVAETEEGSEASGTVSTSFARDEGRAVPSEAVFGGWIVFCRLSVGAGRSFLRRLFSSSARFIVLWMMCQIFHSPKQTQNFRPNHNSAMASLSASASTSRTRLADIPELREKEGESLSPQASISEEELEERRRDEEKFYTRLLKITEEDKGKDVDTADYQFLTDFALCNITLTVYRELQNNSFFNQTPDSEDPEAPKEKDEEDDEEGASLRRLQSFETKGRFRLCQLYPLVLRATIGYYSSIAINYYEDTIEQRRYDQVPIGLNAKAYAIVCGSVRKLVEKEMELREQERG